MNAIGLGATLYVPATKRALLDVAYGYHTEVRSVVICLEDSIRNDEADAAEEIFSAALQQFCLRPPLITLFVRPRSIEMLLRLLRLPGINHISGFVLPKITSQNLPHWLSVMAQNSHNFMPTIEGEEAFDAAALIRVRDQLLPYHDRVTAIRIGGNDILNLLAVRRSRHRTAYEGPLGNAIRTITQCFIPYDFAVSAPVFEHYTSTDILKAEVEQDIEHGLLTKTAVHPAQVPIIQSFYQPTAQEMQEAKSILDSKAPAVFGAQGSMCEQATHNRWAGTIVKRAQIYGVNHHSIRHTVFAASPE